MTTKLRHSAGTPASIGGQFKAHIHPDSDVALEQMAVPSAQINVARAIAGELAGPWGLYPEFQPDGSIVLRDLRGGVYYILRLDDDCIPVEVATPDSPLRYDSAAFGSAEEAAYLALGRPVPSDHERNNRHIAIEIQKATGLFHNTRNLNGLPGDPAVGTGDIRVATGPDGERIYVKLQMEFDSKPHKDQDMHDVEGVWSFSMSGTTASGTGRHLGGGQNMDDLRASTGRNGIDTSHLVALWERNHLNDLHAGTARQELVVNGLRLLRPNASYAELYPQVAGDRGYKYGSAWLYKPVPADDVANVIRMLRAA